MANDEHLFDYDKLEELEARLDDLCLLTDRVEALEGDRATLINEVKDIMTAFENRVLGEIESLTGARIEPMDKVVGGLMVTIADLTASMGALLDIYSEDATDADYNFNDRFASLKKTYHAELIRTMKEASGFSESKSPEKDSTSASDR